MSNEKGITIVKDNNGGDSSDLPAAAAALSPEDRADLLNALKDKLQSLARKQTDILQTLTPKVQKRVEVLKNIQVEHDELEAKFLEEKAALEAKYEKLYEPLYLKRFEIVNGVVEFEQEQAEAVADQEKDKAKEEKGVPEFWLIAMKTNEIIANEITERDERALKYLKDIRCCRLSDPKGFKLEFLFDPNPYFKNSVLTKTYHLNDDDGPVLEKVIGTEVVWFPGKCLTQKVVKKKPRKGSNNANKPVTKTLNCESFFNFFKPPEIPEIDEDDDDDDVDADLAEELQNLMDQDYDVAMTIRDKLIPHAVSWFTGEALDDEDEYDDDDDDEEGDEGIKK